jgi:O-Antigen ligase
MKALFFLVLMAGIGNTVFRIEVENPYTLYRLVAPLGLLTLLAVNTQLALKALGAFLLFAAYNGALATAYDGGYSQLLPSLIHYLYLLIPLVLMIHLKFRRRGFERSYIEFVQAFYAFLLLNLLAELVFGSYYPNLYVDETDENSLRAFFWNQNDLAVVLCVVAWFALTLDRFRSGTKLFVVAITVLVLYYNDSKAALISLLFVSLPVWAILRLCATYRIPPSLWAALFSTISLLSLAALVAVSDTDIRFANDNYSVGELLLQPIINIVTLQASGETWGSINNRTDAAIFVIIEYMKTLGLGLGAGGSWLVLSLPQYELGGAQSPHNALLQFVVDFGYPVLVGYLILAGWAIRRLFSRRLAQYDRLKVMAILSFPVLGLSQSGAIVTNYFFFAAIYFIWLCGPATTVPAQKTARAAPPALASAPTAA